ncbi:MAG: phosphate regulon sensor histidine kinase PhoR [Casimicrobiaceae bacterium]|nr:phosphate regulon sensor histidine kinase PhoR [Casimicrobiaceae bacterium]MCX8097767.1 phosphate regulon sensor histidine kinase PhoR [Casimicrobiaceae bacterium]MDW8311890.1 phosphate regulon sensor histidine kinase PhoR [Burkholderiales bacterium]
MTRTQVAVAVGSLAAILAAAPLSPWLALALLAAVAALLYRRYLRLSRTIAELLRDPAAYGRPVADNLVRLRERLRAGEEGIRARDAEIAQRRQITNAIPDGLFLLDRDHRIIWCNRAAIEMHALDAVRDIGRPITQLIRAPELLDYLNDRTPNDPVLVLNGRTIAFRVEPAEEGERLLLTRDVTERERLDRMRRDFVANVSHELRTPLTVVSGLVETLLDLPLSEAERVRYLQTVATQTERMRHLVEDLLTLARLENEQIPLEMTSVDMQAVVRAATADAEALSAGKHRFVTELEAGHTTGSASELRSAVHNLLTNAVRYTPAGGTITVRLVRTNEPEPQLKLEVIDSGIGIAPEHIPRLTERFYRVDRSRSRETGGTGLGLAIVKHVVQRHRGRLEIESVLGRGSTFRLVLPALSA